MLKKLKVLYPWKWYYNFGEFAFDWKPQVKEVFHIRTDEEYDTFLDEYDGEYADDEAIEKVLAAEKEHYIVEYDEKSDGLFVYKLTPALASAALYVLGKDEEE